MTLHYSGIAHVGVVVDDLDAAMASATTLGLHWSPVLEWDTTVRHADGRVERRPVRFVTSQQGNAHLKMIESAPDSIWACTDGRQQLHHLTMWVDDIAAATVELLNSGEWRIEADGLETDGSLRFRYLLNTAGLRVELGLLANKTAFDRWAAGGEHV